MRFKGWIDTISKYHPQQNYDAELYICHFSASIPAASILHVLPVVALAGKKLVSAADITHVSVVYDVTLHYLYLLSV